ncbi:hypothetical protein C8A00DRAFT_17949 [Chaetomidium leptoderma]|uniref:Uncharacterized protein n=1 Tax=Chaetomidium leptoderma TaxID=669021 RepID=A0AAN6ZTP4_9PEZI|nr:hypothetical protein C8A00DRAFT_17949 [Chaetomidium leptoderma]
MANNANKQTPTAKDSLQEEQELEDALYRLDQLRRLRSALPRMLEPLMTKHPTPQLAFAAYMQSIDSTNKEVASFQEAVHALNADGVFTKAHASKKASKGNKIKQWRASEHPDWASPDRKRRRIP